jgi:hypothetical protein
LAIFFGLVAVHQWARTANFFSKGELEGRHCAAAADADVPAAQAAQAVYVRLDVLT